MTLKKPAQQKRASQPRNVAKTRQFGKDWERLSHSGRYDMRRLKEAMLLLIANDGPLPPEYLDHEFSSSSARSADCSLKAIQPLTPNAAAAEEYILKARAFLSRPKSRV
jgi:mRNA interferase YafQ